MSQTLEFSIEHGDILSFPADVVALKYAQDFYGADWLAAQALGEKGISHNELRPPVGEYRNVYLEIGYAWGRNVPTILLVKDINELKFDVKGQKCLVYRNITHLEEVLAKELTALLTNKVIKV